MEIFTKAGDLPGSSGKADENQRADARRGTFKRVKIIVGTTNSPSVIDALVIDESLQGLRVQTGLMATVPEWVTLRFADGATFRANRRWARGLEIGFKLVQEDSRSLLDAMISGLTPDQRRALIARIESSLR